MEPTPYERERARFSAERLKHLQAGVARCPSIRNLPHVSVFVAGSYGRHEASEHSDVDPFFISADAVGGGSDAQELAFFGELKRTIEDLHFPPFTDDGAYLQMHRLDDIATRMGGREDDWKNHFTARMLLLLEGRPIYNPSEYKNVLRRIIREYFRDYEGHEANFTPLFLLNDIHRYWKTLLINYEYSRNSESWRRQRALARVKNFKLGYSRMTTCFATIAAVTSHPDPVTEECILDIVQLTPRERLRRAASNVPEAEVHISQMATMYDAFLELTALPTEQLHEYFADDDRKRVQGARSREYGALMYRVLSEVSRAAVERGAYDLMRYLVI